MPLDVEQAVRIHLKVRPLTILDRKGTPLVYLLVTNGTPLTHYLSLELCISFYYCKCTFI